MIIMVIQAMDTCWPTMRLLQSLKVMIPCQGPKDDVAVWVPLSVNSKKETNNAHLEIVSISNLFLKSNSSIQQSVKIFDY
jgi:hypothetical protein